jgi:hypothetical protein
MTARFPTTIQILQRLNGPSSHCPALIQFLVGKHCIAFYTIPRAPSQLQEEFFAAIARNVQNPGFKQIEVNKTCTKDPERDLEDDFVFITPESSLQTVTTMIELDPHSRQILGTGLFSTTLDPEIEDGFLLCP